MCRKQNTGWGAALPVSAILATAALLMLGVTAAGEQKVPFKLTSSVFKQGGRIPERYTCKAENISPDLAWTGVPKGTVTLALIMEDPDAAANPWVHWVLYNIDPKTGGLPEGAGMGNSGAVSGTTSFKAPGYGGPCPPVGRGDHHYYFTLYALSADPNLKPGATRDEVLSAIKAITIEKATLMGLFSR